MFSREMIRGLYRLLLYATRYLPPAERAGQWRPWQPGILERCLAHSYAILQGCRQVVGKTYIASFIAILFLLAGLRVTVAMPTLRQGSRILLDRINQWMLCIEPCCGMRRRIDNTLEIHWTNGATLMALSTNEAATKGAQGYTCDLLIIDEGHETPDESYSAYSPLVAVAMHEGRGMVLIMGVGGSFETAIIEVKKEQGYHLEFWPADACLELDPSWTPFIAQQKIELTPEGYAQMHECQVVRAGGRPVFPGLLESVTLPVWPEPDYIFGIDAGKLADQTVLMVAQVGGVFSNYLCTRRWRGIDYITQAEQIAEYIDRNYEFLPYNVGIEVNGPGEGLADALKRIYPFHSITRVVTTDNPPSMKKTNWIKALQRDALKGRLGVGDAALRRELLALSFEYREDGRMLWPHSDALSAMWVTKALRCRPVGV